MGRLTRRRALDIGCGSGILGIAAAKSFPRCRVTAVDIEPGAYHATRENARRNRVAARMTVREGSLERTRGTFGLILPNLYLDSLRETAPQIARRLAQGGRAVLSGLRVSQTDAFQRTLEAAGLVAGEKRRESGWSCLTVLRSRDEDLSESAGLPGPLRLTGGQPRGHC